jgi:hypothetical protein
VRQGLRELAFASGESLFRGERAFSSPKLPDRKKPRPNGGKPGLQVPIRGATLVMGENTITSLMIGQSLGKSRRLAFA